MLIQKSLYKHVTNGKKYAISQELLRIIHAWMMKRNNCS